MGERMYQIDELGTALIKDYAGLAQRIGNDPQIEQFFFLGSGPYYGLACEAMLKMKEMSLSYSEAFHFLEFRHGPMSMVNSRTLIVGLLSETAFLHEATVLKDMASLGAKILAVTPKETGLGGKHDQILLPAGLSDLERGPLYLPILQLLAFYRSLNNGKDPDQPTNLRAVVHLNLESN
jgi:glucosamine--fructose-6-phosphate aminotransferase (isomerizing)